MKKAGKRKAKPNLLKWYKEFVLQMNTVLENIYGKLNRIEPIEGAIKKMYHDTCVAVAAPPPGFVEAIIKLATNGRILLVPGRCDAALVLTRPLSSEPMGCGKLGHVDYETHLCLYCLEMKRGYDGKLAKGRQFGPAHLSHLSPGCPDPWHKERGMVNSPLQCPSCRSFVWDKTGLPGETKEAAQ